MVRIRKIGGNFYTPDDFREGAIVAQPYLIDMQAYQDYLDGDMTPLYSRMSADAKTNDLTGMRLYKNDNGQILTQAFFHLNVFLAAARYVNASVFEVSPVPVDSSPEVEDAWNELRTEFLKAARQAVEWRISKGRGILQLQTRYPDNKLLVAIDPQYYVPLVDMINRDIVVGDVILQRWYWRSSNQPVLAETQPNRVTVQISVTPEQAALSDGRIDGPVNTVQTFVWAGQEATGVLGSDTGRLQQLQGKEGEIQDNARSEGVWTFGDDDSLFKTMERNVFEFIMAISNMRSTLTQDVRSTVILPRSVDPDAFDANGNFKVDPLRPQYEIPADGLVGGSTGAFGYVDPPGPTMAAAYIQLANLCLDNLAYTASMSREAFGLNMQANESGEALSKLQQIFKTQVMDIRDELSRILSEAFKIKTGHDTIIAWEREPFTQTKANDERIIAYKNAGLVSVATAQQMLHLPVEEINDETLTEPDKGGTINNTNDTPEVDDNGKS